jgi:hypothetical protein
LKASKKIWVLFIDTMEATPTFLPFHTSLVEKNGEEEYLGSGSIWVAE